MLHARPGKQRDASGHILALAYRNLWFWPLVPLVLCLGMASVEAALEARELLVHRAAGRGGTVDSWGQGAGAPTWEILGSSHLEGCL